MMRNLFLVFILTSGVWGLSTALVHAQDTEDATETRKPTEVVLRLEQVTVTATKTKRDTLTTPGEVSVLTQKYFQQRQAQSLDDVLRYEPGVDSGGGREPWQRARIFEGWRVIESSRCWTGCGSRFNPVTKDVSS